MYDSIARFLPRYKLAGGESIDVGKTPREF